MKVLFPWGKFLLLAVATGSLASCHIFSRTPRKPVELEFRLVDPSGAMKGPVLKIENGGMGIPLAPQPVITTADVDSAQAKVAPDGTLYVDVILNPPGAIKLGTFTARHRMGRLGIIVNGDLLTMPVIKGTMQGRVSFNVQLERDKARALARAINDTLEK